MDNPSDVKRWQLQAYIRQELIRENSIRGVVAIGSVAAGTAGLGSDIDAFVFLDPLDLYAVPAEFQWRPSDGSYHGIFVDVDGAIQLDLKRVNLQEWAKDGFDWPEPTKQELSTGWIAYDPEGEIARLIEQKTAYSDGIRRSRIDRAILNLDQLVSVGRVEEAWHRHGPAAAHDRLNDAYEQLIGAIFACNRKWRPWRSREQSHMVRLNWLPTLLQQDATRLVVPSVSSQAGYLDRANALRRCFAELQSRCQEERLYDKDPISEAFERCFNEPGRDWNIMEWVEQHNARNR
jgi:predicted nucleotidyltransferase